MFDLIKCELFKLSRNKAVKIVIPIALGYCLLITLFYMVASNFLDIQFGDSEMNMPGGGVLDFIVNPTASKAVFVLFADASNYILMLTAVVCSVVVVDFQRGIVRNLVMSGHSRIKIYFSKIIVMAITGAALFLAMSLLVVALTAPFYGWGKGVSFSRFSAHVLLGALMFASVASFTTLLAFFTKNTVATICISFGLIMLFAILGAVSSVMAVFNQNWSDVLKVLSELYIGNTITYLADYTLKWSAYIRYLIIALITLALSVSLGALIFQKNDLK